MNKLPNEQELKVIAIRCAKEISPGGSAATQEKLQKAFLVGYGKAILDILQSGEHE